MTIYNRTIQDMTIRAMGMASTDGQKIGRVEMVVYSGALDVSTLAVKVKQIGAVIRTYWTHDDCRIAKYQAVKVMRNHEETVRSLSDRAALTKPEEAKS